MKTIKIVEDLACIALRPWLGNYTEKVVNLIASRLKDTTDPSKNLSKALCKANDSAWKTLELALAGDSWWQRVKGYVFHRAEDRELARQIRAFLKDNPLPELAGDHEAYRAYCLKDLQKAREQSLFTPAALDHDAIARQIRTFKNYSDPGAVAREDLQFIAQIATRLKDVNLNYLAWLLDAQVHNGTCILVSAVRYYFRRQVETNQELFQGLTYVQLERIETTQEERFRAVQVLIEQHGEKLDELLTVALETRQAAKEARDAAQKAQQAGIAALGAAQAGQLIAREAQQAGSAARDAAQAGHQAVLDLQTEVQQQVQALGEQQQAQFQQLYQSVQQMLEQLQMQNRPLRPSDSMALRDERDRQRLQELLARYETLTAGHRRECPALTDAVGRLEFAMNDFDGARQKFAEVAAAAPDVRTRAQAHYNAYRAALEQLPRRRDEALEELKQAITLDPDGYAPFPVEDYEPLRILGAGGFGVTFLCRNRHSRGEVAIKALMTDGLDRDLSAVFEEAHILEQLNHSAIIRIRDCKYADRARTRPYLIMDYFRGQTLEQYVEQNGPLSLDDFLAVMRPVAEALHAAHRKGILHRDVKPANLLGRREGQVWDVRVIDFGLAMKQSVLSGAGSTVRQARTVAGHSIAGTLDYAAPEQMGKLRGVTVGPPADIYGFAKTCCYLLFQNTSPTWQDWKKVPDALAELLGQCLHLAPDQRPASLKEVLQQLENAAVPVVKAVKPSDATGKLRPPRTAKPAAPPHALPATSKPATAKPAVPPALPTKPSGPPPLPAAPPSSGSDSVQTVIAVAQPVAAVRFFMPARTSGDWLKGKHTYQINVDGTYAGEGTLHGGFDLRLTLRPGKHALEVVHWDETTSDRKRFEVDLDKPGEYAVRFMHVWEALIVGTSTKPRSNMQASTIDVLQRP